MPKDYNSRPAYERPELDDDDIACLMEREPKKLFNVDIEPTTKAEYKSWAAACSAAIMMSE